MPSVKKLFSEAAAAQKATGDPAASAGGAPAPFEPPPRIEEAATTPPAAAAVASTGAAPAAAAAAEAAGGDGAACSSAGRGGADRRPQGEAIEVVARHAIQGVEVMVVLPKAARFKHIKQALAKCLGSDEVLTRGQLMKKEGGIYNAFKDAKRIGDVRHVLVVCADFTVLGGAEGEQVAVCGLAEEDLSDVEEVGGRREAPPPAARGSSAGQKPSKPGTLTRTQAIELQNELFKGFSEPQFQRDLKALEKQRNGGSLKPSEFSLARQELFLSVQRRVLPEFGFEGSSAGVYKMMGSMGPFVKDAEFVELAKRINELIGLDSPPETWGTLSKSCQKLEAAPEGFAASASAAPKAKAKGRPAAAGGAPRFGLGFGGGLGGLGGFGAPPTRGLGSLMPQQALVADPLSRSGAQAPPVAAEEAVPAAGPAFEPWPSRRPPPFKLYVAGTFNSFSPTEMDWDEEGSLFLCPIQVGSSGQESFQLVVNADWQKTLYPSASDAGPFQAHDVLGPDGRGHGKNWKIGRSPQEEVKAGSSLAVIAALDSRGKVRMVDWQPF